MAEASEDLVTTDGVARCWWCVTDADYIAYHDREWGRPVRDDQRLFEKVCLEGFQAGLAWLTVLRRRPALREAFAGFDPWRLAAFTDDDVARLAGDARIIRNRAKIAATIANARAYVDLVEREGSSLADLVWSFAPTSPPAPRRRADVPATTPEAAALARALKGRGWRFVGPTTAYAFMQSMGLVDDHLVGCAARRTPPLT